MRVCIGIPVVGAVKADVYHSHLDMMVSIGRDADVVIPPVKDLFPHDRARTAIIKAALKEGCEYLLFLDSDMHPPRDLFAKLLYQMRRFEAQMAVAHTYRRGYPYTSTWFKTVGESTFNVLADSQTEPEEIDSCGLACNLIDLTWVKANLKEPFFYQGQWKGEYVWEDAWFCHHMKLAGGKIVAVPSVRVGHLGDAVIINDDTADWLRKRDMLASGLIQVPVSGNGVDDGCRNEHQVRKSTGTSDETARAVGVQGNLFGEA